MCHVSEKETFLIITLFSLMFLHVLGMNLDNFMYGTFNCNRWLCGSRYRIPPSRGLVSQAVSF